MLGKTPNYHDVAMLRAMVGQGVDLNQPLDLKERINARSLDVSSISNHQYMQCTGCTGCSSPGK